MNKFVLIALVLAVIICSTTATFLFVENINPKFDLNVTYNIVSVTSHSDSPHINVTYTNPNDLTLHNCAITVGFPTSNNTYEKFVFYEYKIDPHETMNRIFEADNLSLNNSNAQDSIVCEGYGYLKPLPPSPNVYVIDQ
jgi:hypothetical protein